MTWSPGFRRRKMASMAAIPEPNAMPCFPFSSAAIFCSSAVRVGLETREYSYPLLLPRPCWTYVDVRCTGIMIEPVVGSGCWPAWIALVERRMGDYEIIRRSDGLLE